MERNILIWLSVFFVSNGIAQSVEAECKKNLLYLAVGKPTHTDMTIRENGFLITLGYQRQFSKRFAWEVFLGRSSADSTIDFIDDTERLVQVLNAALFSPIGIDWSKIETYALGAKLHFFFVNTGRHSFSLNSGLGYYTSKSLIQGFDFFSVGEDNLLTNVGTHVDEDTVTEPFLTIGLFYLYDFGNKLSIGLEATLLLDQSSDMILYQPVLANYYNFGISLGKRF